MPCAIFHLMKWSAAYPDANVLRLEIPFFFGPLLSGYIGMILLRNLQKSLIKKKPSQNSMATLVPTHQNLWRKGKTHHFYAWFFTNKPENSWERCVKSSSWASTPPHWQIRNHQLPGRIRHWKIDLLGKNIMFLKGSKKNDIILDVSCV